MDWLSDVRYGLRLFRKSPLFTLIAIGTLALGIGANAAIFSVVDAVIIRALPYTDPDRIVMVWEDASFAGFPRNTARAGKLQRVAAAQSQLRGHGRHTRRDRQPHRRWRAGAGARPGGDAELLSRPRRAAPQRGRTFTDEEDRTGAQVVVITHGLWQRRYGGDPSIVGRARVDERPAVSGHRRDAGVVRVPQSRDRLLGARFTSRRRKPWTVVRTI